MKPANPFRAAVAAPATRLARLVASGRVGFLLVALIAFGITKGMVLPLYAAYGEALLPKLDAWTPLAVRPYYTPSRDHTLNLMMMGAILGYYVNCAACSLLDLFAPLTWKTQGHRSYFTLREWLQAVGVSTVNMWVFSWFVTVPTWHLQRTGALRGSTPVASLGDEFVLSTACVHFCVHAVVIDVWFYWTHWLIHQPPLYKWIHKMHHRFKAPTSVACMYAHPVEYDLGNVLGVILGPALTNCHPYMASFWMAHSLVSTSSTHSGYRFLGAQKHDWHHEHFDYQFGTMFTDWLFGTKFEGSEKWKRVMARMEKQKTKEALAARKDDNNKED